MRYLDVARLTDAPVAVVWDVLVDVDQWPRWGPSVRSVDFDGDRIQRGSCGRIHTAVGPSLAFEITDFVERERWSWSVGGVPATDHRLEAVGERTLVTFGVPWFAPAYRWVCTTALMRIDRILRERVV